MIRYPLDRGRGSTPLRDASIIQNFQNRLIRSVLGDFLLYSVRYFRNLSILPRPKRDSFGETGLGTQTNQNAMALKIHFYIRPQKAKKNGEAPIYLRLTGDERKEYSIGYSLLPSKWDKSAYRSRGKKPADYQLNHHIESMIGAIKRIETNLINDGKPVSVKTVLNTYLNKGDEGTPSLIGIFKENLERRAQTIGLPDGITKRTLTRYKTVLKHVEEFIPYVYGRYDLNLSEMTYSHVQDFEHYLQTVKGIQNNARVKYLRMLKGIVKEAIKSGKMDHDPFLQWKGRRIQQERIRLTSEELKMIEAKELHFKRLDQVRDIFVFSCYTGLAYVDAFNLKEEHLVAEKGRFYLQTNRQKTNSPVYVPLLQPALDILKKYEDYPGQKISGKLLPVKSNQKMNSYLKEIAGLCGIEKTLTFHVARHTFATTVLLANDVPIETVKELLGHKDIATTQHYAKMVQKKVDRDMDSLASKLEQM